MYNQGGGRPPLVHQRYLTHNTSQNIPLNINFNPTQKFSGERIMNMTLTFVI